MAALLPAALPSAAAATESFVDLAARARAARDSSRLDQAVALYRQALALNPAWKDGWWALGTIYYDRDDYRDAAPAFQRLLRLDPRNGTGHAMLGLCEYELGEDQPALSDIRTGLGLGLLTDEGLRKVVLYHEGVLLLRQSRFGSAQDALSLLAGYGVREDQLALALGMAALSINPRDLPQDPGQQQIVLWSGRAEILGAQRELPRGEEIYARLVSSSPGLPGLHYAYGRYLLLAHKPEEAAAEFEQEIRSRPGDARSYLYLAAVRYRVDSAGGLEYARDAVRINPALPFGHYMLGLLYADTHAYAQAIPELERASRELPGRSDVFYALGEAYARVGRAEDAAGARQTFRRLAAESGGGDEPKVHGDNPAVRMGAEAGEPAAGGGRVSHP